MSGIGEYFLRLCIAAVVGDGIQLLLGSGPAGKLGKTICGIYLCLVAVSPLTRISLELPDELPGFFRTEENAAVAKGEDHYRNSVGAIITQQVQAYILNKAAALNAAVEVEAIQLDPQTNAPTGITLRGSLTPYQKQMLSLCIQDDLGIEKEGQIWRK